MRTVRALLTTALVACFLIFDSARSGFDEDGHVDLLFTGQSGAKFCLGGGNGGFDCSLNDIGFLNDASDIDIGDVNGDGHLDVVLAHSGRVNQWCAGNGMGGLIFCRDFPGDGIDNSSYSVRLGDVNRDYNLDAVFGNQGKNRVCLGDGGGGFDCVDVSEDEYGSRDVDLADFNGDRFPDAVFANSGAPEEICLWRESEGFECSVMDDDSRTNYYVATSDMNGDDIVDIVFANREPDEHQLCLGDNSGHFTCETLGMEATNPGGVALGDVNDDGHEDAIFANIGHRNRACLGDGNGTFNCIDVSMEESWSSGVALADVTEDGQLELVFANRLGAADEVCQWDRVSTFNCAVITGIIPGYGKVAATSDAKGVLLDINAGFNDAWYNPETSGQGFLITAFPDIKQMFVAWFTFDTVRPPEDVEAVLGEPGHRWLTAQGPYAGNTATLTIYLTEGGVFNANDPPAQNDSIGDGTMTIEFADCKNGLVTYEIDSPKVSGEIPVQRITDDNVALCEALADQ